MQLLHDMAAEISGKQRRAKRSRKRSANVQSHAHGVTIVKIRVMAFEGDQRPIVPFAVVRNVGIQLSIVEIA